MGSKIPALPASTCSLGDGHLGSAFYTLFPKRKKERRKKKKAQPKKKRTKLLFSTSLWNEVKFYRLVSESSSEWKSENKHWNLKISHAHTCCFDRDISFANRKEEQAARVLSLLAEKQDFTQRPWSGEEAGLDHGRGPGGMHPLQSRWVDSPEKNVWRDAFLFFSLRSDMTVSLNSMGRLQPQINLVFIYMYEMDAVPNENQ